MKLSEHFNSTEFQCKCGCKKYIENLLLVQRLELLRARLNSDAIRISSGTRCPAHSVKVGGTSSDAHTLGIAADIIAYKNGAPIPAETTAATAEIIGFGGIGIIDAYAVHVDNRDKGGYKNSRWFGNERTGETFDTFQHVVENHVEKTIEILIDGKSIYKGVIK